MKHSINDKISSKERVVWGLVTTSLIGLVTGLVAFTSLSSNFKFVENRYTPRLIFNNSDSYRNVTLKNEVEGVKDIEQLVLNSLLEEAWVYYPRHKVWEEVGINSWNDGESRSVRSLYPPRRVTLSKPDEPVYFYHFHPAKSEESVRRKALENFRARERLFKTALQEDYGVDPTLFLVPMDDNSLEQEIYLLNGMNGALPSAEDLQNIIYNSVNLQNREAELKWKICSTFGVTELFLTEKGKSFYAGINHEELEQHCRDKSDEFTFASPVGRMSSPPLGFEPVPIIKKVCGQLSNDGLIQANFLSYAEFYSLSTDKKKSSNSTIPKNE